jgi:hypothetical protein
MPRPCTGPRRRTRPVHREDAEQASVVRWANLNAGRVPALSLLFHVPNGGGRNPREAARLKGLGVRRGVPDLWLPVARGGHHGLVIELKAPGGTTTAEQRQWIDRLRAQGYRAEVCHGWHAATTLLAEYLGV